MAKVKKAIIKFILVLLAVTLCVPFVACGDKTAGGVNNAVEGGKEVTPCGLYTDLQFSINGENGRVKATVKNKFTLLPSTVTVTVELYRSSDYEESIADMTMVASNKVYDLDQGKTVSASASTEGKAGYWKARASYRIDSKTPQEKISETVYFNANGLKTTATAPAIDDTDYYVSDFLQSDSKSVEIHCFPERIPHYEPDQRYDNLSLTSPDDYFWLENEEQINTVRELFGEIKLDSFDMDNKSYYEQQQFYFSYNNSTSFHIKLNDGSTANISINNRKKDVLGANLFVQYYKHTGNEDFNKYFTATISEQAKQAVLDGVNQIYRIQHNINAFATEWINFADLLQGDVLNGNTDLRVKFPFYGESGERIKFSVNGAYLSSVNNILSEVKVTPYDMNKAMPNISSEYYFNTSIKYSYYSLSARFGDGRAIDIYISNMYSNGISVNLFIVFNDGGAMQYYSGLLDVETQEALVELTKNFYNLKNYL